MRATTMPKAERVTLLDAAMQSGDPDAYLEARRRDFAAAKRDGDALMARVIRALLQASEIETVMCMRAEWAGLPHRGRAGAPPAGDGPPERSGT